MYNSITRKFSLFLILIFISISNSFSQIQETKDLTLKSNDDNVYGLDPTLYNGLLYTSFNPTKVKGDQYLLNGEYQKGEATIRGVCYKNIDLNYDIYRQEVLLKYLNSSNFISIIMLSKAWLTDFKIGDFRFVLYGTHENPKQIYQVLGNDSIQLLYYWQKKVEYNNDYAGSTNLWFSIKREQNILMNKTLYNFKNNNGFLHPFDKEKQVIIKKYLRQNKIKVNSASNQTMEELINYCSKISIK